MNKKKLLKKLLIDIKPYWDMAEGVLLMLEWDRLEEGMIDYLLYFLHKIIKKLETEKNASQSIQNMYQKELQEKDMLYKLKQQILNKS